MQIIILNFLESKLGLIFLIVESKNVDIVFVRFYVNHSTEGSWVS